MKSIIELAREAGFDIVEGGSIGGVLKRFAALVRAAALEEAARVCSAMDWPGRSYESLIKGEAADECAAAIRALKQTN